MRRLDASSAQVVIEESADLQALNEAGGALHYRLAADGHGKWRWTLCPAVD